MVHGDYGLLRRCYIGNSTALWPLHPLRKDVPNPDAFSSTPDYQEQQTFSVPRLLYDAGSANPITTLGLRRQVLRPILRSLAYRSHTRHRFLRRWLRSLDLVFGCSVRIMSIRVVRFQDRWPQSFTIGSVFHFLLLLVVQVVECHVFLFA
ncbi:hypothetical protein FPV67DRAFT_1484352 [Lyophyllum atratum]|nr:hypothetical protein FPV67DRAFT_1484352 [Lyophyllum atratum]